MLEGSAETTRQKALNMLLARDNKDEMAQSAASHLLFFAMSQYKWLQLNDSAQLKRQSQNLYRPRSGRYRF